jgi:photosystem II stability/assembly factor-like uncharacterized protein
MALPSWVNRSLVALALFVGLLALATFVRRTSGEAVRPPPIGLPRTPDYHSLLVDETDPKRVWLGTHVGLYESRDGGRSWRIAGLEGEDAMNLVQTDEATIWAAGHYVFAKSTDGGRTWSDVRPGGLPSLDVHALAADREGRLYAAVAGEGLFRSDDGGNRFELLSREVGPSVMALAVAESGRLFAGDMNRGVLVSDNQGKAWRVVLRESATGLAVNRAPARTVLASGPGVYRSTDGGANWKPVLAAERTWGVSWSADGATAYAVTVPPARVLYRTDDGGESWRPVVE